MSQTSAWYSAPRADFLASSTDAVVGKLTTAAAQGGWHIEEDQEQEWRRTVTMLKGNSPPRVVEGLEMLRGALRGAELAEFHDVILEYDFKRRGLRLDCVLLAPGVVVVIEFKRTKITAADRDQVSNYAINLVEFHELIQKLLPKVVVVPIVVLTAGKCGRPNGVPVFHKGPWASVLERPLEADRESIREVLGTALRIRNARERIDAAAWLASRFSPSSTILDAAISLYGSHEVSAIKEHEGPVADIKKCTEEVADHIRDARQRGRNRIILVSGAPGAGKTLVGLNIAFLNEFRRDSVFVTGNAPLVKVLNKAFENSYRSSTKAAASIVASGYTKEQVRQVIDQTSFKLVAAHAFLGQRGHTLRSTDGSIVVFDEAQRTYEKGKQVLGKALTDHEADLILQSVEVSHKPGAVIVALLGHNQAINAKERGASAWFEAAERHDWDISIGDATLDLAELKPHASWRTDRRRYKLEHGHLHHSMRFYRNKGIEEWAHALLEGDSTAARRLALTLKEEGHTIWMTRSLAAAKQWARDQRAGEQRAGLLASGQAKRLIAEGIFPNHKPPIEHWMLAPSHDCRSSDMLETVQNQYQIQGLELDHVVLCWGADLRHQGGHWAAFKLSGPRWNQDKALDVAKNGYRVLLSRARRAMTIYVPMGDQTGQDETRDPTFYEGVAAFLAECGVEVLE